MPDSQEATKFTQKNNKEVYHNSDYDWKDQLDFEFAGRGLIAVDPDLIIKGEQGKVVWDMKAYRFLQGDAPATVNPSLWRIAMLNSKYGLFKVTDRIYQVRGYDLSNISFVETSNGYIIIDPLISAEAAHAALKFVYRHLGEKPVVAVIYSHSHIDHWAGVRGVISEDDVKAGKVKVIASQDFVEAAISENIMVGNAMSRRATYMYGTRLEKGSCGQVDSALGKTTSLGTPTLIAPTNIIPKEGKTITIDGLKVIFQYAPGEAPTGMHVYFPERKTLYVADNCYHSLHNVYTIRGARTRDAIQWHDSLCRALQFNETEVIFGGHNWPRFGRDYIQGYLRKQRDTLKYLHDQTLHLMNKGYISLEIANMIELPPELAREWYLKGYYGSLKHDVRGIYSYYLGWYDANPATLDPLPPREASQKFLDYMGGSKTIMAKARQDFEKGNYRWVAQIMDHVVWAEPNNASARELAAEALTQLGFQTENATWRNAYLTAASELKQGIAKKSDSNTTSADIIKSMDIEMFFDFLGISLNGPRAFEKKAVINWCFKDTGQKFRMTLENAVLNYEEGLAKKPDVTLTLSRDSLNKLILKKETLLKMRFSGEIKMQGRLLKLKQVFGLFDQFDLFFPIATHEKIK